MQRIRQSSKAPNSPLPLTAKQLQSRQAQLVLIDVRSWLEYVLGHIPGARHLSRRAILNQIPQDQPIVVNCLSGHRSAIAAQWLVKQGYQQVYDLQGGVLAWQASGYSLRKGLAP